MFILDFEKALYNTCPPPPPQPRPHTQPPRPPAPHAFLYSSKYFITERPIAVLSLWLLCGISLYLSLLAVMCD